MITLHTLPGAWGLESLSPFCAKVEVYLKVRGLPYRTKIGSRGAPKGKFPWIVDEDGTALGDSSAILARLEGRATSPLDEGLDPAARARAHVLQRTFEESLYFVLLWSRWVDDVGWAAMRSVLAESLPAAVRWFLPTVIRRKVSSALVAQGTGRHRREEIYDLGRRDLEAISKLLGEGPYFLGDRLRTIDVTAYAFLANVLAEGVSTPLRDAASALPNLGAFVERVAADVRRATESATGAAA